MKLKSIGLVACLALGVLAFQNCSNSGSGGENAPASVTGLDYSGTYKLTSVACYNKDLTTYKTGANITGQNSIIVIKGNSLEGTATTSICTVKREANLKFIDQTTLNITNIKTPFVTDGSCTITDTLDNSSSHTVIPLGPSTITQGDLAPDIMGAFYIKNKSNGTLGLLSKYKSSANSEDLCFLIYRMY